MKKLLSISLLVLIFDQVIKLIVSNYMTLNESIKVINKFFYLTYVQNIGAAWSILSGNRILLILVGIFALVLIYLLFIKNKKLSNFEYISYGLLIGGIVGNLLDRIIYGYVIDYLDLYILGYDYPIFNIADISIVVSVILLIIINFKGGLYDNNRK